MRFWSISLGESQATTRVMDGVFDEEFPVNSDGYVTFVASNEQDRPRFAPGVRRGLGELKNRGDGVGNPNFGWLSIRNMLPGPETTDNFFAFKRPGDERQVLGEHYPELRCFRGRRGFRCARLRRRGEQRRDAGHSDEGMPERGRLALCRERRQMSLVG